MKKFILAFTTLTLCSCVSPRSQNSRNTASEGRKVKNEPHISQELIGIGETLFVAKEIKKDSDVSSCSVKAVQIPENEIKDNRAFAIILSTTRSRDDGRVHDLNEVIAFLDKQKNLVLLPYIYDFRTRTPSVESNSYKVDFKQYSHYGPEYRELEFADIKDISSLKSYTSYTGRGWNESFLPIADWYQPWSTTQLKCIFK